MNKNYLLFFYFIVINSFAQYTSIPDPNFEKALILLGYDNVEDGRVRTYDIADINYIELNGYEIESLKGIEGFRDLEILNVVDNKLKELDLSKNYKLKTLDCSENEISFLDLSANTKLTQVFCKENEMYKLNVTKNILLTDLDCSYNRMDTIDVTNNKKLLNLYIGDNEGIMELDVTNLTLLKELHASSNALQELDLSNNPRLKNLIADNNKLKNLDLSHNPVLENIYLYDNQLYEFNMKNGNNTNIVDFELEGNENLFCVQVDDPSYSRENWIVIDPQTKYSLEACSKISDDNTTAEFYKKGVRSDVTVAEFLYVEDPTKIEYKLKKASSEKYFKKGNIGELQFLRVPTNNYFLEIKYLED